MCSSDHLMSAARGSPRVFPKGVKAYSTRGALAHTPCVAPGHRVPGRAASGSTSFAKCPQCGTAGRKAPRAIFEQGDNEGGPFIGDQVEHLPRRTGGIIDVPSHGFHQVT